MATVNEVPAWRAELDETFEVYHRTTPDFMDASDDVLAAFPDGFVHVANVRTAEVGHVFELTNSIHAPWWLNAEITPMPVLTAAGGARSTSVGDVLVKALAVGADPRTGAPRYRRWAVQRIGLKPF